jgi:hypothetical protein
MRVSIETTKQLSVCDECASPMPEGDRAVHLGVSLIVCLGCADGLRIALTNELLALKRRLDRRV